MTRNIRNKHHAAVIQMGTTRLRQAIPLQHLEQVSPFILLHHFDFQVEPGINSFDVPPHPHRGFSPITYMFEGSIQHDDSLGNTKVISDNEVQWINAARGIIHAEKMGREFLEEGGRFQGVQLWINVPAAEKMKTPSYQPITSNDILLTEREGVEFRLVSGEYEGRKGPADSEVFTAMLKMEAGSTDSFSFPATNNVVLYLLEGELKVNDSEAVRRYDMLVFENMEGTITIEANADAKILLLAGEPIDEPLVTHGPFVMNTQTEILEAMRDYQDGKMGFLY